jgi:hypothetical protein
VQPGEGGIGDGCFTIGQAKLLPEKIWSCTIDELIDESTDEASQAVGKPIVECHYDSEAKCVVHPKCDWCSTSDKVCARSGGLHALLAERPMRNDANRLQVALYRSTKHISEHVLNRQAI